MTYIDTGSARTDVVARHRAVLTSPDFPAMRQVSEASDIDYTVVPSGAAQTMLTVSVVRSVADFDTLATAWPGLLAHSGTRSPFLGWTWLRTWLDVYLPNGPLLTIVVRDGEKVVAVAPLWIARRRCHGITIRELRFIGSEEVCPDHLDIVADDRVNGDVLDLIWRTLFTSCRREWDRAQFAELTDSSRWGRYVVRQMSIDNQALTIRPTGLSICPYLRLPESFDAYLATLGPKTLAHLKRSRRHLQDRGTLVFQRLESTDAVGRALDWLIEKHKIRFRRKQVPGSFELPRFERFHRLYCQRAIRNNEAVMFVLRLDDRLLSVAYCLQWCGVLSLYQHTTDLDYDPKLSIGRTMQGFIIEHAIAQGWKEYDLLRGDEAYKWQYTTRDHRNVTLEVCNRTGRALGVTIQGHLKDAARTLRNWVRPVRLPVDDPSFSPDRTTSGKPVHRSSSV